MSQNIWHRRQQRCSSASRLNSEVRSHIESLHLHRAIIVIGRNHNHFRTGPDKKFEPDAFDKLFEIEDKMREVTRVGIQQS